MAGVGLYVLIAAVHDLQDPAVSAHLTVSWPESGVHGCTGRDAVRNCSHCRRETDDDCAAWLKFRKAVAVLMHESGRLVKGADELREATGRRPSTIYEYHAGSVAYFAPDAPDFAEAGRAEGRRPCHGPAGPR